MAQEFSYKKSYDEFKKRTNEEKEFIKHITANREKFTFPDAKVCVSYGTGTGEKDRAFIETLLPGLTTYVGVEPEKEHVLVLREVMANLTTDAGPVKCEFVTKTGDEFDVEDESVDIILMFHLLYHIENPVEFMKTCLKKLRPGGAIIVYLQRELIDLGPKFGEIMRELKPNNRNLEITLKINEYVEKVGFSKVRKSTFGTVLNMAGQDNKDLVNFRLLRETSEEEVAKFRQYEQFLQSERGDLDLSKIPGEGMIYMCKK